MHVCVLCGKEVEIERKLPRKSTCPACGGDLHICLNCRFYSETSHNKCLEPKAEYQRTRERANFCDYFQYREGPGAGGESEADKEEARRKFDDLFK